MKNKAGIVFLEALIAIAIMAFCLALIVKSLTSSLRASVLIGDYSRAVLGMENLMFDLRTSGIPTGRSRYFEDKFNYSFTTESWKRSDGLTKIDIQVMWPKNARNPRSIKLTACIPERT